MLKLGGISSKRPIAEVNMFMIIFLPDWHTQCVKLKCIRHLNAFKLVGLHFNFIYSVCVHWIYIYVCGSESAASVHIIQGISFSCANDFINIWFSTCVELLRVPNESIILPEKKHTLTLTLITNDTNDMLLYHVISAEFQWKMNYLIRPF